MVRVVGSFMALVGVTAWLFVACAADPLPDVPSEAATPDAVAPVPESTGTTVAAANPPPTATAATTPPPATDTPARVASIPTPISQPSGTDPLARSPERFLIRLQDDLDDPLGYCIDVRGFGAGIRLDADLQAHSCKSSAADDQAFAMLDEPPAGGIVLVDYDVCLAVPNPQPGASVLLNPCGDAAVFQRFQWLDDGRLQLIAERNSQQPNLCVGVAGGAGEPAGGRNHLRRDLLLRDCADTDLALIAWRTPPNP